MSSYFQRPAWPREVPPPTPGPARHQDASDFLSETSPEFEAVRRAAAGAQHARNVDDLFATEAAPAEPRPPVAATRLDRRRLLSLVLLATLLLGGAAVVWRLAGDSAVDEAEPAPPLARDVAPAPAEQTPQSVLPAARAAPPVDTAAPAPPITSVTGRTGATNEPGRTVRQTGDAIPAGRPGRVDVSGTAAAPATAAAPEAGWVSFRSPLELDVFEAGRRLGSTRTNQLLLAAGAHDLELVADTLEFRTTMTGVVTEGRGLTLPVTLPAGRLSINAIPWANVWIGDRALGSTPLANVAVVIGDHELTFRHPDLGERRQTVRVGARTPVRVGMDLTAD